MRIRKARAFKQPLSTVKWRQALALCACQTLGVQVCEGESV